MGRNAKLKKIRREAASQPLSLKQEKTEFDSTHFVNQLEEEGYSLDKIKRSPSLPDQTVKPQL
ncbi:MAG TPA: hypothetical protein DEG17_24510 [Cyanobacteria bacterium UBA11149]|nr:hypothetical protein [Cyanobacteria bacterium UBA11367]HBE56153.1 hypothetical protein [Cyanobacteria bacterium UBA11366]HBK63394.1 hypothetical protein [Cyanobacteria bacterium UBA11166]HBR73002.1 hypothetical protein [Cyanobacteria bacterium UBA11159]HBS69426.1 hypothetical protein [Cyanobacteria bacterium UBA11153]HBW91942.1 hypothetical protein [Cyanobacteria bacterium UBA11149]HCA96005.1 hypothetical protein [Cyanobacteria bacterium UBA9226]